MLPRPLPPRISGPETFSGPRVSRLRPISISRPPVDTKPPWSNPHRRVRVPWTLTPFRSKRSLTRSGSADSATSCACIVVVPATRSPAVQSRNPSRRMLLLERTRETRRPRIKGQLDPWPGSRPNEPHLVSCLPYPACFCRLIQPVLCPYQSLNRLRRPSFLCGCRICQNPQSVHISPIPSDPSQHGRWSRHAIAVGKVKEGQGRGRG